MVRRLHFCALINCLRKEEEEGWIKEEKQSLCSLSFSFDFEPKKRREEGGLAFLFFSLCLQLKTKGEEGGSRLKKEERDK